MTTPQSFRLILCTVSIVLSGIGPVQLYAAGPPSDSTKHFAGKWEGARSIAPMSARAARFTQPVTLIVSADEKQVFFQIHGTPGRVFRVTEQKGRTLTWKITEMIPYPGYGKGRTSMSMSLTVHQDELTASLSGFHKVLTGALKGTGDTELSGDFRKVN